MSTAFDSIKQGLEEASFKAMSKVPDIEPDLEDKLK